MIIVNYRDNFYKNFNQIFFFLKIIQITALLGGMIYFKSGNPIHGVCNFNPTTARNISTAIFYSITVMVVLSVLAAAMSFPNEIPIFIREVILIQKINSNKF